MRQANEARGNANKTIRCPPARGPWAGSPFTDRPSPRPCRKFDHAASTVMTRGVSTRGIAWAGRAAADRSCSDPSATPVLWPARLVRGRAGRTRASTCSIGTPSPRMTSAIRLPGIEFRADQPANVLRGMPSSSATTCWPPALLKIVRTSSITTLFIEQTIPSRCFCLINKHAQSRNLRFNL